MEMLKHQGHFENFKELDEAFPQGGKEGDWIQLGKTNAVFVWNTTTKTWYKWQDYSQIVAPDTNKGFRALGKLLITAILLGVLMLVSFNVAKFLGEFAMVEPQEFKPISEMTHKEYREYLQEMERRMKENHDNQRMFAPQ